MSLKRPGSAGIVLVLLTGLGWGLLGPGSKALFADAPAFFNGTSLAVARSAWALPMFLVILAVAWRLDPPRLGARQALLILIAGLVFGPGITVLFSIAAQHTSIAHISFLIGVSPVTNTAVAAIVFRAPLDRRGWASLVLGVLGVGLLALTQRGDGSAVFGDLLMIVWLAGFAAYACLLRAVGPGVSSSLLMALVGSVAMLALLVPGVVLGYGGAIAHVADTPKVAWWFFGEVVFGSTLVAQTAYAAAVRRLGVSIATIGAEYTALAVGVAISLLLHESWTPLTVVAGLLLCCALAVTFVPSRSAARGRSGR